MDGSALPFKALQVFLQYGGGATALGLLRQRGGAAQRAQQPDAALHEAGVAVAVLLESGLLAEAYMEVRCGIVLLFILLWLLVEGPGGWMQCGVHGAG